MCTGISVVLSFSAHTDLLRIIGSKLLTYSSILIKVCTIFTMRLSAKLYVKLDAKTFCINSLDLGILALCCVTVSYTHHG